MTPHNEAKKEDIAKIVLMPGDPLRAKMIAETYLNNYKLVNTIRGMYAYTGYYKNKLITVMASGMGTPSIGIYSYELYKYYDVDYIIRVGTMGALTENLNLYDMVLATESYSLSNYAKTMNNDDINHIDSSKDLNERIITTASKLGHNLIPGLVYTTDAFYGNNDINYLYHNKHCLGVEMETFALFYNAKILNKTASAILTISDSLVTHDEIDADKRQNSLNKMIEIALETTINL